MTVPIEVEFDSSAINEHLAKMILESYLGDTLKKNFQYAVSRALGAYGSQPNVLEQVAREVIRAIALEELNARRDELVTKVRESLTDEFVAERIKELTSGIRVVTTGEVI